MTKNAHEVESGLIDLIDLGAASVETHGGTPVEDIDNGQLGFRDPAGLSAD